MVLGLIVLGFEFEVVLDSHTDCYYVKFIGHVAGIAVGCSSHTNAYCAVLVVDCSEVLVVELVAVSNLPADEVAFGFAVVPEVSFVALGQWCFLPPFSFFETHLVPLLPLRYFVWVLRSSPLLLLTVLLGSPCIITRLEI